MLKLRLNQTRKEEMQMANRIIFFSGGLSSFAVAHEIKIKYPDDNIVLYFTDTLWEDEDLYRFINEVSDKLQLPMLTHSLGIDPVMLMIKQRIIFNSRMGNCSTILKMKVASNFIKKGILPPIEKWRNKHYLKAENFTDNATLYFGIDFTESHRVRAIRDNWLPFETQFPLVKEFIDIDKLLDVYKISKPRMYLMGFTHNNCKGRCVKAGKGHYKLLFNEDHKTFEELMMIEHTLSRYVGAYHQMRIEEEGDYWVMAQHLLKINEEEMIKWHESGYTYKPWIHFPTIDNTPSILKNTSLKDINNQMKKNCRLDLFDEIGGCGCFVDYEDENEKL